MQYASMTKKLLEALFSFKPVLNFESVATKDKMSLIEFSEVCPFNWGWEKETFQTRRDWKHGEKKAELVFHNFVIKRVSWCRHAAAEYYRILLLQHITANVLKQWNAFCSAAFLKIYFNVKVQVVHIFMVTFCVHLLHNNTIVITPLWMYAIAIKWTIKFRVICWSRHLTLATKVNLIWLKNNLCSIIHNI